VSSRTLTEGEILDAEADLENAGIDSGEISLALELEGSQLDSATATVGPDAGVVEQQLSGEVPQVDSTTEYAATIANKSAGTVQVEPAPAIPDSVVAQYNAQKLSGLSGGDTVGTWPDRSAASPGGDASSNGGPTYRSSGINGYTSVDFDGTDDQFTTPSDTLSQKFVVFMVVNIDDTSANRAVIGSQNSDMDFYYDDFNAGWAIFAGSGPLIGSNSTGRQLFVAVFDGADSVIREDGTQTASGDIGTNGLDSLSIGWHENVGGRYWQGDIGFIEIHDGNVSNGLTTREQEIADMWGITL
jgi:hypothetical protein